METVVMNTEKSKLNEPHKFVLNLSERLDLESLKKDVAHQNLSMYCMKKNIKDEFKTINSK